MGVNARQRWRPSLPRARRHPPRSLARRAAPDCGPWPCRVTRQCGDQGCAFIARHNSRVRPAAPAVPRQRPVPVPGDRGLGFLHAARERRPLDELTGVPFTPLRFVRCTPARSSPRSPATPDAGPLNASVRSQRLDRRVGRPTALPPSSPRQRLRGTCGGRIDARGRGPGSLHWLGRTPRNSCCAASSHARLFFRHGVAAVLRWTGSAAKGVRNSAPTATQ